jgi:broad specificity phosphatase PhoE
VSGLLLLRHAQSVWNEDGRWQGWADPPLSAGGERETRLGAARLRSNQVPFDAVVSSDLLRARRTAELMAEVLELAGPHWLEPGLREYDVGAWSGCTLQQIESRWPGETARFAGDEHFAPPGGESRTDFDIRVVAAGRRAGTRAAAAGAQRLLVIAHGGVVRALARAAGQAEYRVGHLAGYWGWHTAAGLFPVQPFNLVDGLAAGAQADSGEGAVQPAG